MDWKENEQGQTKPDENIPARLPPSPSMRGPISVKAFLSFFLSFFFLLLYFFFFQIVPIQPSRLCRHPSIRTLW
jgi:hypothetical protein